MGSRLGLLLIVAVATVAAGGHARALPPPVSTEADCARGTPEPHLAGIASLRSHSFERTAALESVERAVLGDGLAVEIRQSGCAHFGLAIVFDAPPRRVGETSVEAARHLMLRLLRAAPDFAIGQGFVALSEPHGPQDGDGPIEFVQTEGYSSYYVESREENGRRVLTITYGVVL